MRNLLSLKLLIISAALLVSIWLAFGLQLNSHMAYDAAIVFFVLVLWSTGFLPPYLTSLIFFALLLILHLADPQVIFAGFSSAAVWLIVSGFVIGAAITKSGLGQSLAAMLAPLILGSYTRLIVGLTISAMLLGFLMPSSVGRAVVLVPVGMALADQVGFKHGSNGRIGIAVTLAIACNMPSFGILPANIPNMILSGVSESLYGTGFGYTQYLLLHFPVLGIVKMALLIAVVLLMYPAQIHSQQSDTHNEQPVAVNTHAQWRVALILALTLLMWMTDSLHGINPAWVGIVSAICLLLPGVGVVDAKQFNSSVNFGLILFVVAALALGALVNTSGLGAVIGAKLEHWLPLQKGAQLLNFYSLSALAALTGLVTTTSGVPTVLTPMASDLSAVSGLSLAAVLMTQVIGYSTVMFPYQVGPLIVAMQLANESFTKLIRVTLPLALLTFLLLVPLDYFWWRLLGWL